MGFSAKQVQALRRNVDHRHIRTRFGNGRELSYIEGGHAISEANRIFGFDGWSRETIESRCVMAREIRGVFLVVYTAKARITVLAESRSIIREGQGSGEARCASAGEAHDLALKIAETDATKRALVTFGRPFGLALYVGKSISEAKVEQVSSGKISSESLQSSRDSASQRSKTVDAASLKATTPNKVNNPELSRTFEKKAQHEIDKSVLTFGAPRRFRDKVHLKFVASQPCLLCSHQPSDPHHLRFAQPRSLGRKVSDEFTVPLCREHHRQLHHSGNELAWWHDMGISPLEIAKTLWDDSHPELQTDLSANQLTFSGPNTIDRQENLADGAARKKGESEKPNNDVSLSSR